MPRESRLGSLCRGSLLLTLLLWLAGPAYCRDGSEPRAVWVGSWAASQQLVESGNALSAEDLHDATLRQIVHLSLGGTEIRLRLSNRFGATPLHLTAVHVARAVSASSEKIVAASDQWLTFSGSKDVTIPPHADYVSDSVSFPADALSDVAITLHIEGPPEGQTGHPGSRATSYLAHGDLTSAKELPSDKKTVEHWYFIAGIDVTALPEVGAVAVLGDSITDGRGSTTNGNDRWTDVLAQRLQALTSRPKLGVLNQGIGGNRLLNDGLGPNALSRFDLDVIAQPGARHLIVFEGINDIGMLTHSGHVSAPDHEAAVQQVIAAYQQMVVRAHAHNITVIGATLTSFMRSNFYHPGPASEADRQAVNEWIRTPGHFDAVIDFDKITRDPEHPKRLLPAFDSGDHLHPSPAGYAAMARGIPLSLFASPAEPAPKIAITFDDLPAHGPLPPGETRLDVISKVIASLREEGLPPAYGFVNAGRIEEQPADVAVLEAWYAAGNSLANHTWSHMNLDQHSLRDFEQDAARDEPALATLMKDKDWHWFRYPFLAEGNSSEKRAAFRNFLRERGYKLAAVTMSFGDYQWNEPYVRCKTKNDASGIATLENTYLAAAEESIEYYRGISHTLYQRDIPYVLLMHVGAFDAEMLQRLLQFYRRRGFEFVTLPEAERDEFYSGAIHLDRPAAPDTLEEAMSTRGLTLPVSKNYAAQLDSVCR